MSNKFTPEQRIDELEKMGLIYNGSEYQGKKDSIAWDFNFHYTEIFFDDDETFRGKLLAAKDEYKRREKLIFSSFAYKQKKLFESWERLKNSLKKEIKSIFNRRK